MTKAIIYARFSPRRRAAECQSIETQIQICREWCEKQGYEIEGEPFSDANMSGKSFRRPGLWAAIKALKREWVLVVYSSSRLARDSYLCGYIFKKIDDRRAFVDVVSEGGRLKNDPMSRCMRQVRAAFDELDRTQIGKRTSDASLRRQANGQAVSHDPPYGKRPGPPLEVMKNGALVLQRMWIDCPAEQQIISQVVELRSSGKGLREIARQLNEDGVPARGKEWNHVLVSRIVRRAEITEVL